MKKPHLPYLDDPAMRKFLDRYRCPTPLHVVRMRFWGEIVSPSLKVSPIKTIESLWQEGLPAFSEGTEANAFFQAMLGLWNRMAKFQSGSPALKLSKIQRLDTREALHNAANLRVEELNDGFLVGFFGGEKKLELPPDIPVLLEGINKSIELLVRTRNTFAQPPGLDDAEMLSELANVFPVVDTAVHSDLNAIAVAVTEWRKRQAQQGLRQHNGFSH